MTTTALTCRLCNVPLREGDEALEFDVERRINVSGTTARFTDVVEYEHVSCPEATP